MQRAQKNRSWIAETKDDLTSKFNNQCDIYSRYPKLSKEKTTSVKKRDIQGLKRGRHIAFKLETAPDDKRSLASVHFWNHAIFLESQNGTITMITFSKCLIEEESRPVQRDYLFESDCVKMKTATTAIMLSENTELKLSVAEAKVSDIEEMYQYDHERETTPNEVIRRASNMFWDTSVNWDYRSYTSEEFAFYAATGETLKREKPTKMQLVRSVAQQNAYSMGGEVISFLTHKAMSIGLPKAAQFIIQKIITITCREATEELAINLLRLSTTFAVKLGPKMAAACGAIMGGVGAVVGIVVEAGFFAFKISRAIYRWKKKRLTKKEFLRYLFKEVAGFVTSAAGVVTSSIVCGMIGFLVGGPGGIAAGIGTGIGIGIGFLVFRIIMEKVTGKAFDAICDKPTGPDTPAITYKEVQKAVERADEEDSHELEDTANSEYCPEREEFVRGLRSEIL